MYSTGGYPAVLGSLMCCNSHSWLIHIGHCLFWPHFLAGGVHLGARMYQAVVLPPSRALLSLTQQWKVKSVAGLMGRSGSELQWLEIISEALGRDGSYWREGHCALWWASLISCAAGRPHAMCCVWGYWVGHCRGRILLPQPHWCQYFVQDEQIRSVWM